ncbi:Uncharacterised protein [Neisseria gonorrhoeae]|uniref:Lipoprotein n=1 Tax=Neisseria gonorrhoeae TaxID=485 RepID=A0A378W120_NEIGO|nr:Uncharacterised protein [Neisseria gonorrhoeae]
MKTFFKTLSAAALALILAACGGQKTARPQPLPPPFCR